MAENKEYYELLHAYSLGCLDSEDLKKLKANMDSDSSFPWQELGEFQNLSSLLPSILEIETPAPEVKDAVARKLYKIKSEIKIKRDKQKQNRPPAANIPEEAGGKKEITEDKNSRNEIEPRSEDFKPVSPLRRSANVFKTGTGEDDEESQAETENKPGIKAAENEIDTTSASGEETPSKIEEPGKKLSYLEKKYSIEAEDKKKGKSRFITILLLLILVIGIILVYLKITGDVNKYESQINSLKQQLNELSGKFSQNRELQLILSAKDLKIIDLLSAGKTGDAFGKLLISPENGKGFIQLSNMPGLTDNDVYELWISIDRKYSSLKTLTTAYNSSYVSFDLPDIGNARRISFELTREPAGGSAQPGKNIFLRGTF